MLANGIQEMQTSDQFYSFIMNCVVPEFYPHRSSPDSGGSKSCCLHTLGRHKAAVGGSQDFMKHAVNHGLQPTHYVQLSPQKLKK